jgi:heme-degrading monooxygenase HmoA
MYALQEVLRVSNSRQTEAIKRLQWIHSLMKPQPGFVRAQVSRFLGNPTDYLILRVWDSAGDWARFRETPDGANYPKSRPEGLYEGLPVGRNWELAIDSPGSGPGSYLVRSIYKVADGRGDEFVENRLRHDKLALEVAGTAGLQTFRCTDDDAENRDTFLVLGRRTGRDAYNAYLESKQAAEYRAGNTRGLYRTQATECYEIVDEITP